MSTFKDVHKAGSLRIEKWIGDSPIYIELKDGGTTAVALFDPADAPAIALAVLEAGGIQGQSPQYGADNDPAVSLRRAAHYLGLHASQVARDAAAAAEEAARGKRRDELALKFTGQSIANFDEGWVVDLIDQIIDTENELAKERAK